MSVQGLTPNEKRAAYKIALERITPEQRAEIISMAAKFAKRQTMYHPRSPITEDAALEILAAIGMYWASEDVKVVRDEVANGAYLERESSIVAKGN